MKLLFSIIFFLAGGALYAQLGFCSGSKGDPIFHEDFGQGTGTGAALDNSITSYTFVRQDPQDGEYTISDEIGYGISSWHNFLPETTISNGRALIVNADHMAGRFYMKEISGLCENTTYEFSAFLMNVYDRDSNVCTGAGIPDGGIPNKVRFEIWDETNSYQIKAGETPAINSTSSPEWEQFALTFKSASAQESIILKMFNVGDGGCGNDLAIDDIIFRSCGDLTTISAMDGNNGKLEVCEENTPLRVDLEANTDGSIYEEQFFQWQISLNAEDWGDIPGANSSTYRTSMIDDSVFFRVKVAEDENNLSGIYCNSASEVFQVNIISSPEPPVSTGNITVCQNEAAPALRVSVQPDETVNWYDSEDEGNLLAAQTTTYFPISSGTYYAEAIKAGYDCAPSERTAVKLNIIRLPVLQDEVLRICPNSGLILETGISGYEYRWSTGETSESISINSPGEYSVDVISGQGCFTTKTFTVEPVDIAQIFEIISEESDLQIVPETEGEFLYSLDGINYQESNLFTYIEGGVYTAYIKDPDNCHIDTRDFAHIVVPRMITPNNDGYNDSFEIKGVEFFKTSQIQIYDRYGKLIKMGPGARFKWEGEFQGKELPAGDYWYRIKIAGFKDKTGHFSLLR